MQVPTLYNYTFHDLLCEDRSKSKFHWAIDFSQGFFFRWNQVSSKKHQRLNSSPKVLLLKLFLFGNQLSTIHGYTTAVTSSKIEIRSVIRFLQLKNRKPVQSHRKVSEVYGEKVISRKASREVERYVQEWPNWSHWWVPSGKTVHVNSWQYCARERDYFN